MFFESKCSLNIPYTIYILLVPQLAQLTIPQYLCQYPSQKQYYVLNEPSVQSLQEEHISHSPVRLFWGHIIEPVHWNVTEMK